MKISNRRGAHEKKLTWIVVGLLVLVVVALLVFPVGESFTLPFEAEEISSVIIWNFWGYKEATDAEDIAVIVETMNTVRLCGEFDFENYEMREGDYSCVSVFYLKDGRTYEYSSMPKTGLTSIFKDTDGTYYKAKNVRIESIYKDLALEIRQGNPF